MHRRTFLSAALAAPFVGLAQQGQPAWVARSNQHAKILLDALARISPESAAYFGVEGIDDEITDFSPGMEERTRKLLTNAQAELEKAAAMEKDPNVAQDLEILVNACKRSVKGIDLEAKWQVPFTNYAQLVFGSIRALLDDQIAEARRPAALVRLKKYTGVSEDYKASAKLIEQRITERLAKPGLLPPIKAEVEQALADTGALVEGIGKLFEKYKIDGYKPAYEKLKQQVEAYNEFVRTKVLPKARTDFKLPEELYAYSLEEFGVDIPPSQLTKIAHAAFDDLQAKMEKLSAEVAKQRKWDVVGYRNVIRELKKEQFVGEEILPHYKARILEIEDILRKRHLVTVPEQPAKMRLATAAETAVQPAPNMRPPRLIGNKGERAEFVLPLNNPDKDGKVQKYDDFTFAAASWTLTCHEARPGHEMQFTQMIEHGVSTARAMFAFNSTNVEGWGLYAEEIMLPFMPAEGQLISLQHRMMRAARAFLDPELQAGKITPEQASKVLTEDVMLSPAMARQEVERYTFRAPGQATSYYYGYTRWHAIRKEAEAALGAKFQQQAFHDFVLAQGLLPPSLLRKAVMEKFVPSQKG